MGKNCSCLSVPKETKSQGNEPNMDECSNEYNDIMDDIYTPNEQPIDECNLERALLLTNGYIRLTLSSLGIQITEIAKFDDIVELCRVYYDNDVPVTRKRCIFMSILHLNLCIDTIPHKILDESIFCFKTSKTELFFDMLRCEESENSSDSITDSGLAYTQQKQKQKQKQTDISDNPLPFSLSSSTMFKPALIKYCFEKQENGSLLLLEDNKTWNDISLLLQNISDTFYVNSRTYNALKTDIDFWQQQYTKSRFMVTLNDIMCELNENNLKFYPSMEILKQSNPTLIPMKTFDFNQYKLQNGCHGNTWIDNCNNINIQIDDSQISNTDCMNFTYCVGEEEFIQSDYEIIFINDQENNIHNDTSHGFTDSCDSDYDVWDNQNHD